MSIPTPQPAHDGPDRQPDPAATVVLRRNQDVIPFRDAVRVWFLIGLQTFGGPAGQIAVMQRILVDEKRWIGQRRFLHALNYCMLLPGPEAQQLAVYTGWLLNGVRGGIVAGSLFVLPGVVAMLGLSALYVAFDETTITSGLFMGLGAAVIAIVIHAVIRVSRRALTHPSLLILAIGAFAALTLFAVPFPAVVLTAAIIGWAIGKFRPGVTEPKLSSAADDGPVPLISDEQLHSDAPSLRHSALVLTLGLTVWAAPVVAAAMLIGPHSIFVEQGLFFSGAAVVTFGGAYAVLAYVAQQAVSVYGWLAPGEMIRGLALAETTPGPLIMVVQFVAFVGAYRFPGDFNPWVAAILAALITTWVTFVPSFLFIQLGAPYVERLRNNRLLSAALTGITAAVVGVIANLAVIFAMHSLFSETSPITWGIINMQIPEPASFQPGALAVTVLAGFLIFIRQWSLLRTLGVCAITGIIVQFGLLLL
ncbi:chromate efflux transporter [Arthrobacter sp. H5]|uniref:chromate efflux transporter n=1 Tax=Arthrobacter sp. H5 TaxID=1267973 RepID=UPI0004B584CE|nr:chromate efflux transporter [Arthrobacter sp. H5]